MPPKAPSPLRPWYYASIACVLLKKSPISRPNGPHVASQPPNCEPKNERERTERETAKTARSRTGFLHQCRRIRMLINCARNSFAYITGNIKQVLWCAASVIIQNCGNSLMGLWVGWTPGPECCSTVKREDRAWGIINFFIYRQQVFCCVQVR